MKKGMIKATGPFERVVHWCVALSCLFLCITGMGMMYHTLNFVGTLVGGMENLKIIHNYGGIFFGVSLLLTILMWWREAGIFSFPEDLQWIMAAGGYLWHVDKMPEVGKYNPGQKMFFLAVALFGAAMVASGLIIWFPAGFAVETLRWMYVLHALLACRVVSLFGVNNRVGVELACGGNRLVAQIVPESVREMGISAGAEVVAVIKASSFRRLL